MSVDYFAKLQQLELEITKDVQSMKIQNFIVCTN